MSALRSDSILCDHMVELLAFATAFRFDYRDYCRFRDRAVVAIVQHEKQEDLARKPIKELQARQEAVELQQLLVKMKAEKMEINRRRAALLEAQRKRQEEQELAAIMARERANISAAASAAAAVARSRLHLHADEDQLPHESGATGTSGAVSSPSVLITSSGSSSGTSPLRNSSSSSSTTHSSSLSDSGTTPPSASNSLRESHGDSSVVGSPPPANASTTTASAPRSSSPPLPSSSSPPSNAASAATSKAWEDQRLNHSFHFLLNTWRGCQWSGKIKICVLDDPIPGA